MRIINRLNEGTAVASGLAAYSVRRSIHNTATSGSTAKKKVMYATRFRKTNGVLRTMNSR